MVLYLFMMYYQFLVNHVELVSDRNILQLTNVTISATNYPITTSNYYNFQNTYSTKSQTVAGLQGEGLWCAIDGYNGAPTYSNVVNN